MLLETIAAAVALHDELTNAPAVETPLAARFERLRDDLEVVAKAATGAPGLGAVAELEHRWANIVRAAFRDDAEYAKLLARLPPDDPARAPQGVLELLGRSRREPLHTAAIAALLKPSSAEGIARLRAFLELVFAGKDAAIPEDLAGATVAVERRYELPTKRGVIYPAPDIVIECASIVVVIENKIDALDREAQLSTYADAASREHAGYQLHFVYLTPSGAEPTQGDAEDWGPLSYVDLGLQWRRVMARDEARGRRWPDAERAYLTTLARSVCGWSPETTSRVARTRILPYLRAAAGGES